MGHSKKSFKNVYENLGVVFTPLKCFQSGFGQKELDMEEKGVVVFKRKDIGDYVFTRGN
jgi:hypothetical protein